VQRLVSAFDPLRIIVFGSYARGEARPGSDLDLLVVLPEADDKRAAAIAMRRVLADLPVPKDVVVTTPEEVARRAHSTWHVVGMALREGRVAYQKEAA
jgi:predicted nucleotidyltransferase